MKVNVEDRSTVEKILHIEVPEERVVHEIDQAYRDLKKNAKVKGFRPGKTPRGVLQRLYGKDVNADVSARLIQETFIEALKETGLAMVGNPRIEPPTLKEPTAFSYQAAIEVNPPIDDVDFKGLELKKTRYQINEGEIEAQLKMLQRNLAKQKKITEDRPVETGDHLLIDYEGLRDGKPFEAAAKTVNFAMKVGDAQILESFDQQVLGMRVGEDRSLRVAFPDDYRNTELAGLEIDFDVSLKEIREEELPPIDDEMATQLGKYESLDALRAAIRENLTSGYDKRSEHEINEQVFSALIEKTDFELPDSLVDFELDGILTDIERRLTMQNLRMEDVGMTREGLMEKYRSTAEKQVRRHLILNKIVEQESMTLSDEQLEKGFQDLAKNYNQPVDGVKSYYRQNRDKEEMFRHTLLEKQAIELIIDHSRIEEVDPEPQPAEDGQPEAGT